ncbi:MAG: nucleotide exchange factor GrpE [Gammaproteobacteria bacterium]|nr:nucleotide exchange factor GrpE [Gammaproteobacteria bacterium]
MNEHDTAESQAATLSSEQPSAAQPTEVAVLTQTITELQQRLTTAEAKANEHRDAMLRAMAEADNIRRRAERDVENAHKYALERFAQELLPVVDSLEMGLVAATQGNEVTLHTLKEGAELTLKKFESVLSKFNVATINPLDQPFNPELHQAVSMIPATDKSPNTVVTVLQKGYTLNERLIRPAMVIVAQG